MMNKRKCCAKTMTENISKTISVKLINHVITIGCLEYGVEEK